MELCNFNNVIFNIYVDKLDIILNCESDNLFYLAKYISIFLVMRSESVTNVQFSISRAVSLWIWTIKQKSYPRIYFESVARFFIRAMNMPQDHIHNETTLDMALSRVKCHAESDMKDI